MLYANKGTAFLNGEAVSHDCQIHGVPVYQSDLVPTGQVIAVSDSGASVSVSMNIDTSEMYDRFLGLRPSDFGQLFSFTRTEAKPDPFYRRVCGLRGLLKQMRDIMRYEYVRARDGRPPQITTSMHNMRITEIT